MAYWWSIKNLSTISYGFCDKQSRFVASNNKVSDTILRRASCWLLHKICYRFGDASVVYHEEEKDGLVKICRLAMYKKYPKYPTEGFEALYSRPPVIYVSASSKPGVSNYLCLQVSNFLFLFWDSAFVGLFQEFISETIIDRENHSTYNWKLSDQSIQRKK